MGIRATEAGITIEQIVDGTTGCDIWFFIDVGKRECFISEQEQDDGSVVYFLSTVDDLLLIPNDFYLLTNRQQTGANSCIFNSFIFNDRSYEILNGISAEEVLEQGLFQKITLPAAVSTHNINSNPDFAVLAQPKDLLKAFGRRGLKEAWFDDLGNISWLRAAKRVDGKSGRGGFPAYFCPYAVMQGMVFKSRICKLPEERGWIILENEFPAVFAKYESAKPNFDQSEYGH
jgi:hypothetical protein